MPNVIFSPSKNGRNSGTDWFVFGLITANKRYRGVCFNKQLHNTISGLSGSKKEGIELLNAEITDSEIKINQHSTIRKTAIPTYFCPPDCKEYTVEAVINEVPLKTFITMEGTVVNVSVKDNQNCTVFNYTILGSNGEKIMLSSFNDLDI